MKFQDDISNMNTYIHTYVHTYKHTDKPKPICPLLFQSWGHNKVAICPKERPVLIFTQNIAKANVLSLLVVLRISTK